MKATFGTGCFLMVNSGLKPQNSKSGLLSTVGYGLKESLSYALEGSIFSAGTTIQWLRDNMKFFKDSPASAELLSSGGQSNGVLFIPAFTGIGAPHWNAEVRASFYGITRDTSQQDIVTAAVKALIYQVMDIRDALKEDGIEIKNLAIDGGMAGNEKFCQLLADFLGLDIRVPASTESTATGAAVAAGIGFGLFSTEKNLEKKSNQLTIYSPREGILDHDDRKKWKKFLEVLLQAYK